MNNYSEYNLVSTEELFGKIQENLSSYTANGLLDIGRFYSEINLIINKLGIAAYTMKDAIVKLDNFKTELPCDFYLLDSAWLCDENPSFSFPIQQKQNVVLYTETTSETVCAENNCIETGFVIETDCCNSSRDVNKVTVKEFVMGQVDKTYTYKRPILLNLRQKKSIVNTCTKDCKNLFSNSPYEINIVNQGDSRFLYSTLDKPIILLKYYAYPIEEESGLPLIPDVPIIQRAIEYHLMYTFFYTTWLNNDDVNLERKLQDLEIKRDQYLREAINYSKTPSFTKMVELARRGRRKFTAYELIGNKSW